ncbi:hypothetical protein GK047_00630 [Paenibacillus sp. SYP-B3998]|uniref:Citrate transporter-like domain-containing protein n=1 Tax=Paenibacillus sp. SYP-B3998 TaxID=2678564 RepID=A0A6G3ZR67_9BACL|nr:SLC13 family permease [Paenibacillus sp. SYP-B3998]NEW04528.1 hypothetical protein [Paenibacillus sp. SYP-B3998]
MTEFSQGPVMWQSYMAIIIFAATYICILIEKWSRTYTVLGGALLMVLLGIVPIGKAISTYANWHALIFFISLFIISVVFQKNGLIAYLASAVIRKFRLQPLMIMLGLSLLAAVISAFVDGILAIAIIIPITLSTAKMLKLSPVPFLISIILSANIGGAASLLGNVPNRLIGAAAHLTMGQFLAALAPLVIVMLAVIYIAMWILYGKKMIVSDAHKRELLSLQPKSYLTQDRILLYGGNVVLALTVVAFALQGWLGWKTSYIGAASALVLLALDYKSLWRLVKSKNYRLVLNGLLESQILFFFGLFIMVGGLAYTGASGYVAMRGLEISQGSVPFLSMLVMWLTSFGSAMMDNIPYVAAMVPVIEQTGTLLSGVSDVAITPLWWSLLVGAAVGGSATLLGSTVSMFAAGIAAQDGGGLSQREYLIVAGPLSILLLIVATIYFNFFLL